MAWLVEQGEKWKSELQSLKNGIIGMRSNVNQRREKLQGQWKSTKREMVRIVGADTVVVSWNIKNF